MTLPQAIALTVLLGSIVALVVGMLFLVQPPSGREHGAPDWISSDGDSGHHGGGDHGGGDGGH